MMRDAFPVVTLQPVADMRNAWVALLLEFGAAPDAGAL
jgi:hypothetical protein